MAETKTQAEPETEGEAPANAGVAALLNTSLGDLLVAGLVKDPADAGRLIAAAITQSETRVAALRAPKIDAESKPRAQDKVEPQQNPNLGQTRQQIQRTD
jgi:hypothetical protein